MPEERELESKGCIKLEPEVTMLLYIVETTVCQRIGGLIVWMHDLVSQFRLEQTGPVTEITMGKNGPIQSASQCPKFSLVVN